MAKKKAPKQATLDALFSQVIRERDNWDCQICRKSFRHDTGFLDCAHHVGRRRGAVRWDLDNACALCRTCHNDIDARPLDHVAFVQELLGDRYEGLQERARGLMKMTDKDRKELATYMRETLKILKARRADGELGRLDI